jgi:hypothetical protein
MASLTDSAIRSAIKQVEKSRKQQLLADGEGRGTGRLVLILKPMPTRVTAEWMAQQWRDGRRVKSKIGSYPVMSLSLAREIYKRDYADVILKGRSIKTASDARPGTVADLFEAYVKHLKSNEQSSWRQVEKGLDKITGTLGSDRLARDITPDDVLDVIRPIYNRGKRAMADHVRSYVRSAYSWAVSRSTTIAVHRRVVSNWWSIRQPASRQSRRSSARAGSTKTSSFAYIDGLNAPMLLCTRRTRARFAFSC